MTSKEYNELPSIEQFLTIPKAAERLGIPASTLRRAVKSGEVPSYRPFRQRIRLRLSEVIASVEAQRDQ